MEHFRFVLRLLKSTRFWVLFSAAASTFLFDIPPEVQSLIIFLAAAVYAHTTAMEDAALKSRMAIYSTESTGVSNSAVVSDWQTAVLKAPVE